MQHLRLIGYFWGLQLFWRCSWSAVCLRYCRADVVRQRHAHNLLCCDVTCGMLFYNDLKLTDWLTNWLTGWLTDWAAGLTDLLAFVSRSVPNSVGGSYGDTNKYEDRYVLGDSLSNSSNQSLLFIDIRIGMDMWLLYVWPCRVLSYPFVTCPISAITPARASATLRCWWRCTHPRSWCTAASWARHTPSSSSSGPTTPTVVLRRARAWVRARGTESTVAVVR